MTVIAQFQLILAVISFVTMVVMVFFVRTSNQQHYMTALSSFVFLGVLGFYLEMTASEISDAHIALRLEYMMNCFVPLIFVCYMMLFSKHRMDRTIRFLLCAVSLLIIISVYTSAHHKLYYRSISLERKNGVSYISIEPGPLYFVWIAWVVLSLVYYVWLIIRADKNYRGQRRFELSLCLIAGFIPWLGFFMSKFGVVKDYELGNPLTLLAEYILMYVTLRFGLFDTIKNAKEEYIRTMDEGILVINSYGTPQFHNPRLESMFPEVKDWNDVDEIGRFVTDTMENKENMNIPKDGRYYKFEKKEMRGGREPEIRGYIYKVMDVTETNEYNRQLSSLRDEALRASQVKNIFIANISHEIRAPLNSIINTSERLQDMKLPKEIGEYANNIDSASRSLMLLINDILDISKMEAGKLRINKEEYDPALMLYDSVSLEAPLARGKKLPLKVTVNPELPSLLMGDDMRISQCISNIIDNAIKYTEEGHVEISMDFERISEDRISLIISCEDTGIGISEEQIPHLFDTFSVVNSKRNKDLNTFSISLSMSKRLITMMKGDINVSSEQGKGSTFTVRVPQTVRDQEPIGSYSRHVKKEKKKREDIRKSFTAPDARILVCDDMQVNIVVATRDMERYGCKVDSALSGQQCIEMAKQQHYDIIFVDHLMPGMDGIEVINILKSREESGDRILEGTKFIAMTGNAGGDSREYYLNSGFDDYISKPVDMNRLTQLLLRYLPQSTVRKAGE
ncbi:MAG: response regulator [Lachnospiraceae bacterium]|nr:response regulator [Lachnospiraceae bacterium]